MSFQNSSGGTGRGTFGPTAGSYGSTRDVQPLAGTGANPVFGSANPFATVTTQLIDVGNSGNTARREAKPLNPFASPFQQAQRGQAQATTNPFGLAINSPPAAVQAQYSDMMDLDSPPASDMSFSPRYIPATTAPFGAANAQPAASAKDPRCTCGRRDSLKGLSASLFASIDDVILNEGRFMLPPCPLHGFVDRQMQIVEEFARSGGDLSGTAFSDFVPQVVSRSTASGQGASARSSSGSAAASSKSEEFRGLAASRWN